MAPTDAQPAAVPTPPAITAPNDARAEPTAEAIVRVIDACVLEPIPGDEPSGAKNVRDLKLWVELRAARPRSDAGTPDPALKRTNSADPDWATYSELVQQALCEQAKDLELGLFLTDASTRVFGFKGVRDGLWMMTGLIDRFIDKGLYPKPEQDDPEAQYGKLLWLNEKLPDVIRDLPLTQSQDAVMNYSLNYRDESRRQGGMITAAQYDAVASAGSTVSYEALLALIQEARSEFDAFRAMVEKHYGEGVLALGGLLEAIEQCHGAVKTILRKRQPTDGAGAPGGGTVGTRLPELTGVSDSAAPTNDAWQACERLAQSGNIDAALAAMTSLAAKEPNGRIRFQRKLILADLCLKTNRKQLGVSILEELNEIIEQHRLELWETSEFVGGVWVRLIRCYRDKSAGTANESQEEKFYKQLSRLDPWQALNCGEVTKKD